MKVESYSKNNVFEPFLLPMLSYHSLSILNISRDFLHVFVRILSSDKEEQTCPTNKIPSTYNIIYCNNII